MARHQLTTVGGYDFYEVASALQKAIRREDAKTAGFFALELVASNFTTYCWKRLLTISAEDCFGLITREILALKESYDFVNKGRNKHVAPKGRIFVSKAVLLLSMVRKSRDSDHLQNLVYDRKMIDDKEVEKYLQEITEIERMEVPEYTFDCHTLKGKRRGKTKQDFFRSEQAALSPKEPGLFDDLIP